MKNRIKITIIASLMLFGCTSSKNDFEKEKYQLEQQGYTDVKNTGYSYFCCNEEDTFSTGFTALDRKGNMIEGCFCSTLYTGVTIRFK